MRNFLIWDNIWAIFNITRKFQAKSVLYENFKPKAVRCSNGLFFIMLFCDHT